MLAVTLSRGPGSREMYLTPQQTNKGLLRVKYRQYRQETIASRAVPPTRGKPGEDPLCPSFQQPHVQTHSYLSKTCPRCPS